MRTQRSRSPTGLSLLSSSLLLVLSTAPACGSPEQDHGARGADAGAVSPGLGPRAKPAPEAAPEPEARPEPSPEPAPDPVADPELDERKEALANVGRAAFDALQNGEFAGLMQLTPEVEGYLRDRCPGLARAPREELEARFDHCHRSIAWDGVAEAQVFAGKPTGEAAEGCEAGVEGYGRLQLFLHMRDQTIWRVDFYGAVGEGGNAIGINGEIRCQQVDEAPAL